MTSQPSEDTEAKPWQQRHKTLGRLLEEIKLLGVSIVRKKGIKRMSASVSTQTSDQRGQRKEDLGLAIGDRGKIVKITKRIGVF
jgi:hypothetical protein